MKGESNMKNENLQITKKAFRPVEIDVFVYGQEDLMITSPKSTYLPFCGEEQYFVDNGKQQENGGKNA